MSSNAKIMNIKYIIISPVRNEEKYIEKTIYSVINQTIKPLEWIIINDGSTDMTKEIVEKYTSNFKWIKLIDKKDRGFSQVGKGVIEAFNTGFKNISYRNWGYIVKLDCDVSLERDFLENLLHRFSESKNLGIAGGTSYALEKGRFCEEKMPEFHPWAGARMYKRKCFEDIRGLVETLGWDTIDLLRAQMKDWQTKRFRDLKVIHCRRMASRKGLWEGKLRTGRNFYITGYHPLFLVVRSIYRLTQRPYLIESIGVVYGYVQAMWKRESLVVTSKEKVFLRSQQLRRLFGFKIYLIKKSS